MSEALPAAEDASEFRGSAPLAATSGRREAVGATVVGADFLSFTRGSHHFCEKKQKILKSPKEIAFLLGISPLSAQMPISTQNRCYGREFV